MSPTRFIRRSFALLTTGLLVASCTESPAGPELSLSGLDVVNRSIGIIGQATQATIGPLGGVIHLPDGNFITFPAGALSVPTTITAVSDNSTVKVDFGPEGLTFPANALPTLSYNYVTGAGLTDADASHLSIVYLDQNGNISQVLPTVADTAADLVHAKIHHFSTYAMATD